MKKCQLFFSKTSQTDKSARGKFEERERGTHDSRTRIIVMFEKLFAWCGLHRPGKEENKDGGSSNNNNNDNNNDDNVSDIGSEASSMISVEEIDPKTGQPVRVLKKKRSLIGRAYRKVTKTRSGKKKNEGVEGVSGGDADLASASA